MEVKQEIVRAPIYNLQKYCKKQCQYGAYSAPAHKEKESER